MLFNPDINKPAQEVFFEEKIPKMTPVQEGPICAYYLSKTFRYVNRWKIEFQSSCKRKNC